MSSFSEAIFGIISCVNTNIKERAATISIVFAVVAILVGGIVSAWPGWQRRALYQKQSNELAAEIEAKKREISDISENIRRFKSDREFVESIARQNRRVFPGELVFIFDKQ